MVWVSYRGLTPPSVIYYSFGVCGVKILFVSENYSGFCERRDEKEEKNSLFSFV